MRSIFIFTSATMKSRYRKTFAGFIWVIMNPILTFMVHAVIFKTILKITFPNYFLFLLSGLLPWIFITSTFEMTTNIFVTSRGLLKSIKIDPLIILISQILDNFFNFIVAFFLALLFFLFQSETVTTGLFFLPLPLLILLAGVCLTSLLLSTLQVFYRDTVYINNFLSSIMFLLTPIFYPIDLIPEKFRGLVYLNPYYIFIEPFRVCLWNFDPEVFWQGLARSLVALTLIMVVSLYYWRKRNGEFYLYL